ncbi:hypothetical protein TELCIR_07360 [Teladorsagia circumcincta]|uniref:Uncharacterized protein n=1 Tax=Teladorsagia circumcincta TaxID=45464 RepID=A0A2G9UKV5_TELCI|nr:hypothetical protein TELCIR_07360 [Teladorsagia circumcincta]
MKEEMVTEEDVTDLNEKMVLLEDDEIPHSSKDVIDVESLLSCSGPVRRDTRERKPPPSTPITAKEMMETISLTPEILPLNELLKREVPWLDRKFVVEGKQLLELFRCCPLCRTDMEASGSSFECSAEGDNPVVDIHCRVCLESRGSIGRWKGQLIPQSQDK